MRHELALATIVAILLQSPAQAWTTSDSIKVMDVASSAVAYDYSVIALNPTWPYLALFHAEPYNKAGGCWGDSVAARYGSATWNPLSHRVFGTHHDDSDMLITRSSATSEYMDSPNCLDPSGAANPIMTFNGSNAWAIYYLSLRKETENGSDLWRHYLMLSIVDPAFMRNIHQAPMWYFDRVSLPACAPGDQCYAGENYTVETAYGGKAALVWKPLTHARPVFEGNSNTGLSSSRVMSAVGYPNKGRTQGLIGTITADASRANFYFYYTDIVAEGALYRFKLMRRTMRPTLTNFSAATPLKTLSTGTSLTAGGFPPYTPAIKVNYHIHKQKYVVLYNCRQTGTSKLDICMKLSGNADLSDITLGQWDSNSHGLRLYDDPGIPKDASGHYAIGQFNVKKDGWGHHFTADGAQDVIVYFPAKAGSVNAVYGMDVYGKAVDLP